MKLNTKLQNMQQRKVLVTYPTNGDQHFSRFKEDLVEVLRANLEHYSYEARTLDYDLESKTFFFTVEESVAAGPFRGLMTHTFSLNPAKDLAAEVARLVQETTAFRQECFATVVAHEKQLPKVGS